MRKIINNDVKNFIEIFKENHPVSGVIFEKALNAYLNYNDENCLKFCKEFIKAERYDRWIGIDSEGIFCFEGYYGNTKIIARSFREQNF